MVTRLCTCVVGVDAVVAVVVGCLVGWSLAVVGRKEPRAYHAAYWPNLGVVAAGVVAAVETEVVLVVVAVANWDLDEASDRVQGVFVVREVHPGLDFAASSVVALDFDYVREPSMGHRCTRAGSHW